MLGAAYAKAAAPSSRLKASICAAITACTPAISARADASSARKAPDKMQTQNSSQGSDHHIVNPDGPGHRVSGKAFDQGPTTSDQPRLGTADKFIATEKGQIYTLADHLSNGWLWLQAKVFHGQQRTCTEICDQR